MTQAQTKAIRPMNEYNANEYTKDGFRIIGWNEFGILICVPSYRGKYVVITQNGAIDAM